MTPEELDKLEALVKAATSGEWAFILDADSKAATRGWRQISSGRHRVVAADWYERRSGGEAETVNGVRLGEPDAAAIVALHNAAPALIAAAQEVERLRAQVEADRSLRRIAANIADMPASDDPPPWDAICEAHIAPMRAEIERLRAFVPVTDP